MLEIVESSVNRAGSANVLQITERAALFSVLKLKNPFPPFPPPFLLYPSFFFLSLLLPEDEVHAAPSLYSRDLLHWEEFW